MKSFRIIFLAIISLVFPSLAWAQGAQVVTGHPIYNYNGKIGIGTNSPLRGLSINGANEIGSGLAFMHNGTGSSHIYWSELQSNLQFSASRTNGAGMQFTIRKTNNSYIDILKLDKSGKVGIGTTTPYADLSFANTTGNKIDLYYNTTGIGDRYGFQVQNSELRIHSGAVGDDTGGITFGKQSTTNFTENVRFTNDGKVGIGTNTPFYKLTIKDEQAKHLRFENNNEVGIIGVLADGDLKIWSHGADATLFYRGSGAGTESMRISSDGHLGIGTTNPTEKLEVVGNALVNGDVYTKKIEVSINPGTWPDYVFESSYDLKPLSEVEAYIKANKHLPEVPSAKEVGEKGLDLGSMDATLLKKMEEMTLYMIEMKKENEAMKQRIEKMEKELNKLKEK